MRRVAKAHQGHRLWTWGAERRKWASARRAEGMAPRGLAVHRYAGLLKRVTERLPAGWDYDRLVTVALSTQKTHRRYAGALRDQVIGSLQVKAGVEAHQTGHHVPFWHVTLYISWLDRLSDDAVVWVMAHELSHVAAGMPCGSVMLAGGDAWEQVADITARAWGFAREEEAFWHEAAGTRVEIPRGRTRVRNRAHDRTAERRRGNPRRSADAEAGAGPAAACS